MTRKRKINAGLSAHHASRKQAAKEEQAKQAETASANNDAEQKGAETKRKQGRTKGFRADNSQRTREIANLGVGAGVGPLPEKRIGRGKRETPEPKLAEPTAKKHTKLRRTKRHPPVNAKSAHDDAGSILDSAKIIYTAAQNLVAAATPNRYMHLHHIAPYHMKLTCFYNHSGKGCGELHAPGSCCDDRHMSTAEAP